MRAVLVFLVAGNLGVKAGHSPAVPLGLAPMCEPLTARTPGQWKQDILRVYNAVNRQISGAGVTRHRVDLMDDRFLVIAEHQRIPALSSIAGVDPALGRAADVALIDESKRRLHIEWEQSLAISIQTVLKDYDPTSQLAATVVMLNQPLPIERHD